MLCVRCICCKQQDESSSSNNIEYTEKSEVHNDEHNGFVEASPSVKLREKNRFNQSLMTSCDAVENKLTEHENFSRENSICLSLWTPRSCSSVPDASVKPCSALQPVVSQGNPQHTIINVVEKVEIHSPQADAIILGNESSVNIRKDDADKTRKETEKLLEICVGKIMVYMRNQNEVILKTLQEMEQRNKHREENEEVEEPQKVGIRRRGMRKRKNSAKTGIIQAPFTSRCTMAWQPNDRLQYSQVMSAATDKISPSASRSQEAKVAREQHDTPGDDTQDAHTAYPQVTQVVSLPTDSHETEHQSSKDKDLTIIHRSESKRKSKRKISFKKVSKTHELLQSMQWKQYEVIQEFVIRHAIIELQECQSTDEIREKANNFKERLQIIIDEKTGELIRTFSRSSVAKKRSNSLEQNQEYQENASSSLNEYRNEVIQDANDQMEKLKDDQIRKMRAPEQITERNEDISDKEAADASRSTTQNRIFDFQLPKVLRNQKNYERIYFRLFYRKHEIYTGSKRVCRKVVEKLYK